MKSFKFNTKKAKEAGSSMILMSGFNAEILPPTEDNPRFQKMIEFIHISGQHWVHSDFRA